MKLATIQMVSGVSVPANLERAGVLLDAAAAAGTELAMLPEYFCLLGARDTDKLAVQEVFGQGTIQTFMSERARKLGMWIAAGTMPIRCEATSASGGERVFNSQLVFSPQGICVARYDKMHLFRFDNGRERYDESRVLQPGTQPCLFTLPSRDGHAWRIGLSVCYDLRFPELYRLYAAQGAHLLLVPSAFTHTTGQAHWETLLRARAIENLCFVAAPAQGGLHENGRRTWGHSMLVDPWGVVAHERAEGEGVDVADLDYAQLARCRSQLPALEHRVV